jgi:hypothetical protein
MLTKGNGGKSAMSNFVITLDANKVARSLKELDKSKIDEFLEVVNRAYKKKPNPKDLAELRKWINEFPELWRVVFDTARVIEDNFIKNMVQDKASITAMQKNTDEIREGLAYNKSSIMEKMLIDNVIISWLGVQYANYQLTARLGENEKIVILEFWERRLTAAQHRYLRASETLARIRRLISTKPAVQVNIAAEGGQQVNVAGEVVRNNQAT